MTIGCKIVTDFPRASAEQVALFRGMPVANIDDNMNRMGAFDADIVPFGNKGQLLGPAFTVRVPEGDNLMFHAAMDLAKPGDVIVIDAGGYNNRAIFGELMATYCKSRGIAGIVCDGAIRDSDALSNMENFPVYACGVTPNGPYKNGPGEIGVPVVVGGKTVYPGDIIVGDADGVLAIRPQDAEALAAATRAVQKKEEKIIDDILQKGSYIRPWVNEKLKEIGCEFL